MRIKTQFIICLIVFTIVLIIIAFSVADTEQKITYLADQQAIASNIERGESGLNSISVDYFLYQEDLQIAKWNSTLSSLYGDLQSLTVKGDQQQILFTSMGEDLHNLNSLFIDVANYLQSAPRNVSVRVDPAFQFRWDSMTLQSQTLASDASQLSHLISDQMHQTNFTNVLLILSLVGTFGAFLLTMYLLVFRRTLRSVADLQKGIRTIGTGDLNYSIAVVGQNEIAELSTAFNQMTSDLRAVTASKAELERAQDLLRESEQRWATTLSSIGDAVISANLSGNVVFMNAVAEELTGWTLGEATGKPVKEIFNIVNEQSRLRVEDPVAKVLEKGLIVELANHTVLVRKDGTDLPIDDSGAPIMNKEGKITGVVLIFRDITERKKAEQALKQRTEDLERTQIKLEESSAEVEEYANQMEQLAQERLCKLKDAERLAAIGATAGMVGHDIRNPLQAIASDLYLAKSELISLPASEEKKNAIESLDEIEKSINYINKIVQDLQDYARPIKPIAKQTDIQKIFDDVVLRNGIPSKIKVNVRVDEDAATVMADPEVLKRVVTNLVTNAVQAMPEGGELSIKSFRDLSDFVFTVEDSGVGIPAEVKEKLFTPLFTTKSKGQGFGLAVVKRMTEALGGTVTFESEMGKGTKFIIRLPPQKS